MSSPKFLLGPMDDGLRLDVKPFAVPETSAVKMINMYHFRKRWKRRLGYKFLGRLQQEVTLGAAGNITSSMTFTVNLFTQFSITDATKNIVPGSLRNPIVITVGGSGVYTLQDNGSSPGNIIRISGSGTNFTGGTINYLTGDLTLNFSVNTTGAVVISFAWAVNLPCMGLRTRDLFAINAQDLIGFDTHYAYRYSNTNNQFQLLSSTMPVVWSAENYDFFWTVNYANAFWATNSKPGVHGYTITSITSPGAPTVVVTTSTANDFQVGDVFYTVNVTGTAAPYNIVSGVVTVAGNPFTGTINQTVASAGGAASSGLVLSTTRSIANQDGIRYYTGSTWVNYAPPINANNALFGALMIFPYRGYLIFIGTYEGNESGVFYYPNRMRWTAIGTPYYANPVPVFPNPQSTDINCARDDIIGKGGAEDAATNQEAICGAFIRDIIVVRFNNSTWRIRFTQNSVNPFVWEIVNIELGGQSTFGTIPIDKGSMDYGPRGITISDGNDVIRFDDKIPDTIFQTRNSNHGPERVYGIRTFESRLNYWTYPSNKSITFPDSILVYNYDLKSWAMFDDSFTCFGYYKPFNDVTWADLTSPWSSYGDLTWNSSEIQSLNESIVAGNQQGFVEVIEADQITNGPSLNITGITTPAVPSAAVFTVVDHNLKTGDWIQLTGITGITGGDGVDLNNFLDSVGAYPFNRSYKIISTGVNTFTLQEFSPIDAGPVLIADTEFTYTLSTPFIPIYPGSVLITVGDLSFTDPDLDGTLHATDGTSFGNIGYENGIVNLTFDPPLASNEEVYIRVVANQPLTAVSATGTYTGGGYVTKKSNIQLQTKVFNFFKQDQRARISKIDFYTEQTNTGEFTCDIFGDSNTTLPINNPFSDNLRSNVVITSQNPYQITDGDQTIYRLYCDAIAQTIQAQFRLSDQQMATDNIYSSDIDIAALMFSMRPGGRII